MAPTTRQLLPFTSLLLVTTALAAEGPAGVLDHTGRLERLHVENGWIELDSQIAIPRQGWKDFLNFTQFAQAKDERGRRVYRATMKHAGGAGFQVTQAVSHARGELILDIEVRSLGEDAIEGVILFLNLPAAGFAGGTYEAGAEKGTLPQELPDPYHLASVQTDRLAFTDKEGKRRVSVGLAPATGVGIQDGRKWAEHFSALINIHRGKMTKGQTARLRVALKAEGRTEAQPVMVALDASTARYVMAGGIGGNYCFNIDSPITRHTLDHLRVAWGRTEMTLRELRPFEADDATAVRRQFEALDQPGTRLRQELEIMSEFSRRKIPYATSIWRLPTWMYDAPEKKSRNHIASDKWPHLLTAIGEYLRYAKEKYRAEPLSFSFNEPDCGARVGFSPEEHRDALKKIGARLEKLGLKTRQLLGDVCNPRGTVKYIQPVLDDSEALKYCNVASYHSWGGAKPAQFEEWFALARKLKMPLIVGEAGPDAGAWRGRRYRAPAYATLEMVHYQELLLHARPHAILRWEYTGDYGLLDYDDSAPHVLRPTFRYALQKHWTEFIPPGSEGLATSSDHASVLLTAFRWKNGDRTHISLHLSNAGWARPCTLTGVPEKWKTLNVVRSRHGRLFECLPPVQVRDGRISIELLAESLTTFTTADIPDLK